MALTRAEWNARQAKLPREDRTSYEVYLSSQSPTPTSKPAATPQQGAGLLAQIVATTIVNTPVVTNTAKGEAPKKAEVESITKAIVDSLAPSLAPNLSSTVIDSIVSNTTNAIVTNPDIKASGIGQSVTPAVVNQIAKAATSNSTMSKEAWNARQAKLPPAERTSYEEYVKYSGQAESTSSTTTTDGAAINTNSNATTSSTVPFGGLGSGVVAGVTGIPTTSKPDTKDPNAIPTNLSSPEAQQLFNTIKGKATASGYRPTEDEQKFMESYQVNRLELIKGKQTAGNPLTAEEEAEKKFLLERGYGEKLSGLKPFVNPNQFTGADGESIAQLGPSYGLGSGVIAGVKGSDKMQQDAIDAAAADFSAQTQKDVNSSLNQFGPFGGLSSGVVAGVLAPTGYDANGNPTGVTGTAATGANALVAGGGTWAPGAGPVNTNTNTSTNNNNTNNSNNVSNSNNTTTIYNNGDDPNVVTLVSTQLDEYGNTIGFYSDGSSKKLLESGRKFRTTVDEDAYAILTKTLTDAGLAELAAVIQSYMEKDIGPNQAALEIRKEPAYIKRFKGNEDRRSAGLNVLSEAEYLDLENSYMQTLKAYGYANELGADASTRQAAMANLISGDTSAVEFKERIDTIVTRVKNADPKVKETMTSFFGIKDEDLVKYFINPKENLPKLQEKVTAAEIGAAAITQNLSTSSAAATALAQYGITKEQAREGYSSVGEVLPTSNKLGEIYGDKYTQATAEQEVFQGLASAKRKRQQLAEREVASFSGSSGRLRTGTQQSNTGQF